MSVLTRDLRPAQYARNRAQGKTKYQSAIEAGYPEWAALRPSQSIESKPSVRRALQRIGDRAELSGVRVLEELRRVAFSDLASFYQENGSFKPFNTLSEDQRSVLASCETIVKNAQAGDGVVDTILKVKLHDKLKALEILAKHFHLVDETVKVDTDVRITVSWTKAEVSAISEGDIVDVTPANKGE